MPQSMSNHWRPFLTEGIILSVLGLGAIFLVPTIADRAATMLLGWTLMIAGIMGLVSTLSARTAPGFEWSLLSAFTALIAGTVLLWKPLQNEAAPETLLTMTHVLIVFFMADGILSIILALAHRREASGKWEWMMANGSIDLILAGIIISGLPGTLVWVLGLFVGIDLAVGGASLIALALDARKRTSSREKRMNG